MAVEMDLKEEEASEIIVVEGKSPMTVEHFMGLVEHRPHQAMLTVYDKQDGFHYRLSKNNAHRVRYHEALGYEVVLEAGDAHMGDSGQPDRRRVAGGGGLVLMKRPQEYHEMHKQALRAKAAAMHRGPVESFKTKAAEMGVKTIDEMKEQKGPMDMPMRDDD